MAEWMLTNCINVLQLQQQQNRLMKINHDLRHRITVVEAQGKALIEQKVELEAYLQTKEQEMGTLRAELGKLREKLQGEDSQNGEEIQVRGISNNFLRTIFYRTSVSIPSTSCSGKWDWHESEAEVGLKDSMVLFRCGTEVSVIHCAVTGKALSGWQPNGTEPSFLMHRTSCAKGRVAGQVSTRMSALGDSSPLRLGVTLHFLGRVIFWSCTRLQNSPDSRTNHCLLWHSTKSIVRESKISGVPAVSLYSQQTVLVVLCQYIWVYFICSDQPLPLKENKLIF